MSIRITQLPILPALTPTTVFLVVSNEVSYQVSAQTLAQFFTGASGGVTPYYLTYSSDLIIDLSYSTWFKLELLGDVVYSEAINGVDGEEYTFTISQDGQGGHIFTWPTNFLGTGSIAPGFDSSLPYAVNMQKFKFDSAVNIFYSVNELTTFTSGAVATTVSTDLITEDGINAIFTENSLDLTT